jgi:hypothetical protein
MAGAFMILNFASTPITQFQYTETNEVEECKSNSRITILRSADTKICHSIRFSSSVDINSIKSIFIYSDGYKYGGCGYELACVPVQLLNDCGFVHIGKQHTIITTPFKLFFKPPDTQIEHELFPLAACQYSEIGLYIEAESDFEVEILWSLRFLDTEPRRKMAQLPHQFFGHHIYTDFEKVKDMTVSNIIVCSYQILTSVCVNGVKIGKDAMIPIKINDTTVYESLMEKHGLDEFTCVEIMKLVGKNIVLIPIHEVIKHIDYGSIFIENVYYVTDNKIRIDGGMCRVMH